MSLLCKCSVSDSVVQWFSGSVVHFAKAGGFDYFSEGQKLLDDYDNDRIITTAALNIECHYYHDIALDGFDINSDWDSQFYGLNFVYGWGAAALIAMAKEPEPVIEPQPEGIVKAIESAPLTIALPFVFNSDDTEKGHT